MNIFQAIFLGVVQGITEVLPISSSGHLVLIPWIFNFADPGLAFDVSLHIGTLLAIVIYFRKDWITITKGFFSGVKNKKFRLAGEKLSLFIILATIPGILAGYFLNDLAETSLRNPLLIAGSVFIFGVVLIIAEKQGSQKKELVKEDSKSALLTGLAQAAAIIPGVSRSGITISAGMFQGFTREAAARFSFLISAPIIFGAGVFEMRKMTAADFQSEIFWAGMISSVVASFLTVKFLMKFVKNHKLNVFAYYRFALAGVILLIYFLEA
ncbi:MAG: undecaprenyl-diphosphatase UppP [bacterium]|nr:undecaprenyl-diphosphatase UppP [bacterium]